MEFEVTAKKSKTNPSTEHGTKFTTTAPGLLQKIWGFLKLPNFFQFSSPDFSSVEVLLGFIENGGIPLETQTEFNAFYQVNNNSFIMSSLKW